uniref:Uncharacterized protein n=1 Tax=Thermofilum pendens TaxID=2269 RepID=A0A7C3WPE5_THEPE
MRDATGQAVKELLAAALRKLYEKLTVTRGQVALAMELYVAENLSPQAKDITRRSLRGYGYAWR